MYAHRKESLAVNSLGVCLSASSPNSTVLCGMRNDNQVELAIKSSKLPLLDADRLDALFESPLLQ
jgi:hypothetical protein